MRTTDEIDAELVEKMKERARLDDQLQLVLAEIHVTDKEIADREIKKGDLREAARKARHAISGMNLEIELLEKEFWRSKNR